MWYYDAIYFLNLNWVKRNFMNEMMSKIFLHKKYFDEQILIENQNNLTSMTNHN